MNNQFPSVFTFRLTFTKYGVMIRLLETDVWSEILKKNVLKEGGGRSHLRLYEEELCVKI